MITGLDTFEKQVEAGANCAEMTEYIYSTPRRDYFIVIRCETW